MRAALFLYAAKNYKVVMVIDEYSHAAGLSDVVFIKNNRMVVEVEIKASLSDLKKEKLKACRTDHYAGFRPNYFVFCIPDFLLPEARTIIEEDFPFAGIVVFNGTQNLSVEKKMRKIHGVPRTDAQMLKFVRAQSQKYIWNMFRSLKSLAFLNGRRLYYLHEQEVRLY